MFRLIATELPLVEIQEEQEIQEEPEKQKVVKKVGHVMEVA
jgi:hypothetical protein